MKILVCVGTTEFRPLTEFCSQSKKLSNHEMTIQHGTATPSENPFNFTMFKSTDKFSQFVEQSDLIISHAAAGTRLDVISKFKPHIMICNDTLAGNHQMEMVRANINNKSVRVFSNCVEFSKWLENADLEKECNDMKKYIQPKAEGEEQFKKLIEDVQKLPHKSNIGLMIVALGFIIWVVAKILK
uniref:UDP-N-acetylglucosamine transferase subunit ALG13 n=1 Tax=Trepomonas sp. PC1 TaxID=1076344 RepID=A0A146K584_9EUKA|eukprot:JAP91538.1 Glycosyltransferase family 28 protein [Trepomonas sp. PC1]